MNKISQLIVISTVTLFSCKSGNVKNEAEYTENSTPVTLTQIQYMRMDEDVELNATSVFLVKSTIKSPVNGYLLEVDAQLGETVGKGSRLFIIRSKEAENLANTINKLDTAFRFKGTVRINAPGNGCITQLNYRTGDYVQDGETLAAISDINSLVFMLELPYSLKSSLSHNKTLMLTLPDGQKLSGTLSSAMPMVDPVSQTQNYTIKIPKNTSIPENLVAKVSYLKRSKLNAVSLPKEAVLTDEVQSEFWIMKLINDSTAVKVPIMKGIEGNDRIEIVSPVLTTSDRILLTGNFGLPDTARVSIENKLK